MNDLFYDTGKHVSIRIYILPLSLLFSFILYLVVTVFLKLPALLTFLRTFFSCLRYHFRVEPILSSIEQLPLFIVTETRI